MTAVLANFIIGVALPVLPLHVRDDPGFGPFVVGLVAGSQFAASLCSLVWAGSYSDKRGVMVGLFAAAGLLYLLAFIRMPTFSVAVMLSAAQLSVGQRASSSPVAYRHLLARRIVILGDTRP
ncbi:hypothetical protein [Burkholderia stagnalis]|uniref:hypothetical protein n=1 Tax=Burkholderia stagnalis TaxID=1503054 RepID=UPI00075C6DEC|nr:hypothetical protein [Burkholderia stagnalis]KVM84625.1 hypothetical protein WT05_15565 [Burkholderia stagnalis]